MRLFMLFTALVLGGSTPIAASVLLSGSSLGNTAAAERSADTVKQTAPSAAAASASAASASAAAVKPANTQITEWIAQLSKEPGFEAWKQASWIKYPLGPGKRGWVVIIKDGSGMETGYMVVLENDEGTLQLEEYGAGDMPLYSKRTLQWALGSEGLENVKFTQSATIERVYVDAFRAYWKVSEGGITRFSDAKTGEWLPIGERDVQKLNIDLSAAASGLSPAAESVHLFAEKVADPYMNIGWVTAKPLPIQSWNDLLQSLGGKNESLVYRADLFDGLMVSPFGVAGVHAWKPGGTDAFIGYVALEQEGLRYVPFQRLTANGTFQH